MRTVADVAAVAWNVPVYGKVLGGWLTIGGTSVSAPLTAAAYALAGNAATIKPGNAGRCGRMTVMDMKLEVVQVSVSDMDSAKDFYNRQLGFNVDVDRVVPGNMRIVQLTPPGSGCSIQLVGGGGEPQRGLTLVVSDVVATHAELTRLGAPLSEVVHYKNGVQVPGRGDEPWSTMTFLSDPDGNNWIIQERPAAV